ncbi:MAG: multicomponent Na+:H+ antiporter subunit [Thermoleophilaceae bacterium]|jgi:multicomponent Na+:H+ antiporter subunit D|nr:multicomponent Na+:H+ antiporter subunit [Thermoleophilaceae bacterium]
MDELAPIAVAVPLLVAAALVGGALFVPRRVVDVASLLASLACCVLCALVLSDTRDGTLVHWFGGWTPRNGVALGISFAIDGFGAGLALFASALFVAAFLFSWRYFVVVGPLYHALMLVFLAAMLGFSFTGDLFNLFVFFELLSVAAYALVAYDIEEEGPLQGALNFAVTNTIGAFLILTGIALLYGRTGALNMAQIGEALAGGEADGLVVVAFTLMAVGFFVKAAVVPFHFWLADAYSVAPTPVCLLLSAAMSELGLYALARVYWTVFSDVLGSEEALQTILLVAGTLTALVGALMCFGQRHLKRMLAFATVSHVGLFLIGFGLLSPAGLAGVALFIVADGLIKAALFVSVGAVQHLFGSVDELRLFGRGRRLRITGPLVVLCGLAVAALPPFGPWVGKSLVDEAARAAGAGWVTPVFVVASVLTGAAVLRAAARVFGGIGPREDPSVVGAPAPDEVDPEFDYPHNRVPRTMTAPALALAAGGLFIGFVPGLRESVERAAERFVDRAGYADTVLRGEAPREVAAAAASPGVLDVVLGAVSVAGALALAWLALAPARPGLHRIGVVAGAGLGRLRALHTGYVGDYVTWLVAGAALLGGLFAVTLTT